MPNFSGCSPDARVAGETDLPVGADHYIGIDAVDAMFHAVAQIGEDDGAVGDFHMIDAEIIRGGITGVVAGLDGIVDTRVAIAPQRDIQNRLADDEFADLRMPRQRASQRNVGLRAADGEAAIGSRAPWGPVW